jgi:hypothetical protein
MKIELNADFAAWIDRESENIAGHVRDITHEFPRSTGAVHPDHPVTKIGPEDIIGEISVSVTEPTGRLSAQFFPHQGRQFGLSGASMNEAERTVERIWSRKEFVNILSRDTIRELLLSFVAAKARELQTPPLSDRLLQIVEKRVKSLSVWIPIEEVFVDREFKFATATLSPVSKAELNAIVQDGCTGAPADGLMKLREELHAKWAGRTIMRLNLTAEPARARELALEHAADYMTLLQIYTSASMVLSLSSHVAPRGARPYRTDECIVFAPQFFEQNKSIAEATHQLVIDAQHRAFMNQMGLSILSKLACGPTCDYEEKLLSSLLVYGRACYQLDPNDKLLQVMTSIEMFALRSDNEPIQAALADRLAFAISEDPNSRQQIAQNLRDAYSARSGRSHHGRSISDTELVERFLSNAWAFFFVALQNVGRLRTRLEFLDQIDGKKYGHSG